MSRPKPTVLLEHVDESTGKCEQVLQGKNIYAVYYKDKPIYLKSFNKLYDYPGPNYKKTSFSNPAHAYNLAKRLNELFDCDDFNVQVF